MEQKLCTIGNKVSWMEKQFSVKEEFSYLCNVFPISFHFLFTQSENTFILNSCFCWIKVHFWGHWLSLFWTLCNPPHGFQSQGGSVTCTLTCLHMLNVRATSGATSAFSTNRGVYCISVYTAGSICLDGSFRHTCWLMQQVNQYIFDILISLNLSEAEQGRQTVCLQLSRHLL